MSAAALALKEHSMPSHVLHGEQNESIMNKWRCTAKRCWEMKMQAITQNTSKVKQLDTIKDQEKQAEQEEKVRMDPEREEQENQASDSQDVTAPA